MCSYLLYSIQLCLVHIQIKTNLVWRSWCGGGLSDRQRGLRASRIIIIADRVATPSDAVPCTCSLALSKKDRKKQKQKSIPFLIQFNIHIIFQQLICIYWLLCVNFYILKQTIQPGSSFFQTEQNWQINRDSPHWVHDTFNHLHEMLFFCHFQKKFWNVFYWT